MHNYGRGVPLYVFTFLSDPLARAIITGNILAIKIFFFIEFTLFIFAQNKVSETDSIWCDNQIFEILVLMPENQRILYDCETKNDLCQHQENPLEKRRPENKKKRKRRLNWRKRKPEKNGKHRAALTI